MRHPFELWDRYLRHRRLGRPIPEDVLRYLEQTAERVVALQHLGVKRLAPALAVALQIRSHRGKRITASSDFIALQTERNRAAGFVFADLLRGRTLNQAYAETAKKLGISKSTARRAWKQNGSDWLPAATVQVVSGRGDASTRSVSPATLVERNRAHTSR